MQYCAYRDRSQKEVEDKLIEMRMIPAAREEIIIKLMQENFLNEERFARSFVRGKFRIKKWGRYKIKQELKLKDISSPVIRLAMTEINESDYKSTLYSVAEKKSSLIKETNPFKKKKKLYDFLSSKGYESHLILEVIDDLTS
jgi:regulatory protein